MTKKLSTLKYRKKLHSFKNNEITKNIFFYHTSFNSFFQRVDLYRLFKKKFFSEEPLYFIFI